MANLKPVVYVIWVTYRDTRPSPKRCLCQGYLAQCGDLGATTSSGMPTLLLMHGFLHNLSYHSARQNRQKSHKAQLHYVCKLT